MEGSIQDRTHRDKDEECEREGYKLENTRREGHPADSPRKRQIDRRNEAVYKSIRRVGLRLSLSVQFAVEICAPRTNGAVMVS